MGSFSSWGRVYLILDILYPQVLTVSEAKGMLRDIMTLCERQPLKKKLAEVRAKAQVGADW